jgi:hypothetical protein
MNNCCVEDPTRSDDDDDSSTSECCSLVSRRRDQICRNSQTSNPGVERTNVRDLDRFIRTILVFRSAIPVIHLLASNGENTNHAGLIIRLCGEHLQLQPGYSRLSNPALRDAHMNAVGRLPIWDKAGPRARAWGARLVRWVNFSRMLSLADISEVWRSFPCDTREDRIHCFARAGRRKALEHRPRSQQRAGIANSKAREILSELHRATRMNLREPVENYSSEQ